MGKAVADVGIERGCARRIAPHRRRVADRGDGVSLRPSRDEEDGPLVSLGHDSDDERRHGHDGRLPVQPGTAARQEPKFAKFNYAEKMEYWAFMWGTMVMALSGFLLWFNNFALRHFPKVDYGRRHGGALVRSAAGNFLDSDLALLSGDLRSRRLSDGHRLAGWKNSRGPLPAHAAGILSRTREERGRRNS